MRASQEKNNNVFKAMLTLATGAGAGRLVAVLMMPILTRLYSPDDYGSLAIYSSLVMIIAPFLSLRYVSAIPLIKNDSLAFNLLVLSTFLVFFNGFFVFIVFKFFKEYIFELFSISSLTPWWWLIVFGSLSVSLYEILNIWGARCKKYYTIAKSQFIQTLIGEFLKLILGFMLFKPTGLLLGHLISVSGGGLLLFINFKKQFSLLKNNIKKNNLVFLSYYFKSFPIYRLPSQVILISSTQMPLLLTAYYFDTKVTGQLGLALMALALPATLLGDTMSKAFYAEISAIGRKRPEQVRSLTYSVMKRLGLIAIIPTLILFFLGEYLFIVFFGMEWKQAGSFAGILSFYLLFQLIQKPVSYLMYLFNRQKQLLFINFQRLVLILLVFFSCVYLGFKPESVIYAYSLILSVHYILSVLVAIKCIPVKGNC